jgi:transposase
MNKRRSKQAGADWREARCLRAWELKSKGWKQKDIAEALGVSAASVSDWARRGREGGPDALRSQPKRGAPRRLSKEQLAQLPGLLKQGAEQLGFRGDIWTRGRIAGVIQREFGVTYSSVHVGRLLKDIRWSSQKPIERASQRNEVAIQQWRDKTWPELQKKPRRKDGR